jgi:Concanavalin A-like lectin/glucanases superfamily
MRRFVLVTLLGSLVLTVLVWAQAPTALHDLPSPSLIPLRTPVNRHDPLALGLVSWWRVVPGLDGGPRWYDLMGGNPCTVTNTGGTSASGWAGTTRPGGDGELRVDGTNDYCDIPKTASLDLPQGTLALWFRATTTTSGMLFAMENTTGPPTALLDLKTNASSDSFRYEIYTDTSSAGGDTPTGYTQGRWWHLTLTVGSAGNAFYINGVAVTLNYGCCGGSASSTLFLHDVYSPATNISLGRTTASGGVYVAGALDDVRLWNRPLKATEVAAVYQRALGGDQGLLLRWPGQAPMLSLLGNFLPFFH